jgi:hypothetical protein
MVRPQVQEALAKYFTTDGKGYTGSQFELLVSGSDPSRFTERDLVALSTLNVDVPARAALWILSPEGQTQTSALLAGIPNGVDIWKPEVENAFADDGKLMQLWDCLGTANWPTAAAGGGLGGDWLGSGMGSWTALEFAPSQCAGDDAWAGDGGIDDRYECRRPTGDYRCRGNGDLGWSAVVGCKCGTGSGVGFDLVAPWPIDATRALIGQKSAIM